jgi:hypothetical protein
MTALSRGVSMLIIIQLNASGHQVLKIRLRVSSLLYFDCVTAAGSVFTIL